VLSQRLQELPPPHGDSSEHSGRGSPRTHSGDMPFLIDFDQRRQVSCCCPARAAPCTACCALCMPAALQTCSSSGCCIKMHGRQDSDHLPWRTHPAAVQAIGQLLWPHRLPICLAVQSAEVPVPVPADDWELDAVEIKFQERIASGAFGDLYKGTYCGQEVAIKILRNVQDDSQQYAEFLQVGSQGSGLPGSPLQRLES